MSEIKVGDRVRFVGNGTIIPDGTILIVSGVHRDGGIYAWYKGDEMYIGSSRFEKDGSVLDLIANLSAEVARLKYRVDMLEIERVTADQSFKIADELSHTRKEVVKRAQADIEALKDSKEWGYQIRIKNRYLDRASCYVEFIVNRNKRTVVALLRGISSEKLYARGIAKCMPDDVFNSHLGKAIALRRALGVEVPQEYLNAPRPEGVEVGDVVQCDNFQGIRRVYGVNRIENTVAFEGIGWDFIQSVRVIDDSDREEYRSNDRQGRS